MKKINYFDFYGNIPSYYSPFDFLSVFIKTDESGPECEVLTENVRLEGEPEEEKNAVSARELEEAIEAFEKLDLPEEKTKKEEEQSDKENKEAVEEETSAFSDISENAAKKRLNPFGVFLYNLISAFKKSGKKGEKKHESAAKSGVSGLKRFLRAVISIIIVIGIFAGVVYIFMLSIGKENEKAGKFNKNAAEICSNYSLKYGSANYENLYDLYRVEGYRLTGLCFVRELDFDNDGKSELMLTYNKGGEYYNEVWGENKNKNFSLLFSSAAAQTENKADDAYSILYHSKNKYYIAKFEDGGDSFSLMGLKRGEFEKKFSGAYDEKTGSCTVNGKDNSNDFERIKYSVLREERASADADEALSAADAFTGGIDIDTATAQDQTLENAYYQVIADYNKRYGASVYKEENGTAYIDGLAVADLIDFDGDGKNELLLIYRKPVKTRKQTEARREVTVNVDKYYCDIYRYGGNKALLVYSNEGLSNMLNNSYDIYYITENSRSKVYYCLNSFSSSDYGKHISAVSAQYKLEKGEFKNTFKASYTTDYGYSKYYLNGERADKYKFNLEGYKNPFFDGEETYNRELFTVTYVQRKRSKASELKSIPSKTEKTIKSLNPLYSAETAGGNNEN